MKNLREYIAENYLSNGEIFNNETPNTDLLIDEGLINNIKKMWAKSKGDEETLAVINKTEEEMKELAKQQKEKKKEMKDRLAVLKAAREDEKKKKDARVAQAALISAEYTIYTNAQKNYELYLKQAQESDDEVMKNWKAGKDVIKFLKDIDEKK